MDTNTSPHMDIIPPQEMLRQREPLWQRAGKWILLLVAAVLLILLFASWRNGWFLFGSGEPTQEEILKSLTAPGPAKGDPSAILLGLTPPPGATAATNTAPILDSLSASPQ